jgi:hypothetical protein
MDNSLIDDTYKIKDKGNMVHRKDNACNQSDGRRKHT